MDNSKPKTARKKQQQVELSNNNLTEHEIRQRAYQIYLERGGVGGSDYDDWIQAEQELFSSR
jgi:outer membrane protein TolC